MSSWIASPFLFVNLGCEYLFLLENRLKADRTLPKRKVDEVLVDCAFALFEENIMEQAFKKQKLYAASEVRKVFYLVGQSPSLRIDDNNLDTMFKIICMVTKAQLLRLRTPSDMFVYVDRHLDEIRRSLDSTSLGEEVCDIVEETRQRFREWYANISLGEFHRMRLSLLSFFLSSRTPVAVLIDENVQHNSGYLIAPTNGEPLERLGVAKVYDREGAVTRRYLLSVAGKNVCDQAFDLGANLFAERTKSKLRNLTPNKAAKSTGRADANPQPIPAALQEENTVKDIEQPEKRGTTIKVTVVEADDNEMEELLNSFKS